VARSAAIPSGRTLAQEEMEIIVADLLKLPDPNYTPDGKTIITVIPMEQIAKLF
jgi:DNA mismatch repair protein MutL